MWIVLHVLKIIFKYIAFEQEPPFALFQSFEHKYLVICEKEETLGFSGSSKKIVNSLIVIDWSKGFKEKVRFHIILLSELCEDLWCEFHNF